MSDGGEKICPLCAEEMDLTDQQLKPCKCGYEICVWCWHHIIEMAEKDGIEGRCPNCRTAYDKDRIVGADANCRRVVAETNTDKKLKSQKGKSKPSAEARKQLSSVRVIQRNLVYIIGLPLTVGDVNILERREYFGQYGRVLKVSVSRATGANQQPANTLNAYITYAKEDEAVKCIQAVHNFVLDGKPLRACFGTTKYCNTWLRNLTCSNPDCFYLHDIGNQEDSFTKDEIISAYTRTRIPQVATNNLQNRMGSVLPPPVDDFCSTGSVTSAKCASKNSTNNPITSVKGGCRSTALPAAASWGSRTVRHNPTSSSCDKGKQKQDASSLTPVTSSLIETSTWPDDMAKYEENHNDNHSSITNGKSRHSESSQSSSSNDSQVSSAWDDETITLKDPEEHGKEVVNGASGPPATKPFLACEVLGSFSGRPVDTFHEGGVITSAWDDDDEDNVADEENMTHPNDRFVPFQTLKSSGSEKQREFVEAPANDMQDATCTRSEMAKSDGEYQVSAEGLEVTVNHNMGNSNEVMLSNFDNPLHSILMKNSNNVTSNGKMESALSSLDINRHQLGLQENNENWDNDPIILKAVAPRVSGLNQSCHDQFRLFSNHPYGETPALNNDSFLSREPSNLSSMPVKEVVPLIRNEIRNASGLPEIHYQPHSDNKTSYPCIQASDVMENSAYQNNSFGSRHTTDMKKIVNANYLVHDTQHDSKLGNIDAGRNCTYGDSTDSIKRVGSLAFSQNGERVNNRDTSESIIISNMLSMDFDPWSQDAAASTIMKQLTESAGLNASFNSHNSLKSPSNSQSRFSFARQDYQTGYFGSGSQDSTVNGFQNGYTTHTMQGSSPGISSIHSDFSSERTSVISRAKVSAPPGFSAPSRPPPPGFSSQDRSNLLFNSGPSGNQNLMNFSPGYQPQHVSTGDVEFHDPAILAVGKGTMPVKYDLGVDSFFPIQRGVSDIDPKYHLSMNFNLPSNQQHRISGHSLDGILHMNDGFAPRFTEQNHANSLPFSQVPLNSFISTRNSGNSNTHWDYWNHLQSGNNLDSAEIMKNDRLGINYSLTGEDYKFYTANSNKLYNQAFGI